LHSGAPRLAAAFAAIFASKINTIRHPADKIDRRRLFQREGFAVFRIFLVSHNPALSLAQDEILGTWSALI